jgi:manganese transport protein
MKSRAFFATAGAAFAVGIGYMDPGNLSTDFNATAFGYTLLWSILASGAAAIVLQSLVVCVAAANECDIASDIRRRWPQTSIVLWPVYAASILATETAEFTGVTLGLQLLFHLTLLPAISSSRKQRMRSPSNAAMRRSHRSRVPHRPRCSAAGLLSPD